MLFVYFLPKEHMTSRWPSGVVGLPAATWPMAANVSTRRGEAGGGHSPAGSVRLGSVHLKWPSRRLTDAPWRRREGNLEETNERAIKGGQADNACQENRLTKDASRECTSAGACSQFHPLAPSSGGGEPFFYPTLCLLSAKWAVLI